jgi:hypothetical protein
LLDALALARGDGRYARLLKSLARVELYGAQVVDLCQRGYLTSLLDDETEISRALEVGREWLGDSHPAVACVR